MDQLAQELPEQQYNTWIKPLVAQVSDDLTKVTVYVANQGKLQNVSVFSADGTHLRSIGKSVAYFAKNNGRGVFMQAGGNSMSTGSSWRGDLSGTRCGVWHGWVPPLPEDFRCRF